VFELGEQSYYRCDLSAGMDKVPIESVETSLQLLEELEQGKRSITELADTLARPKATVYYHLKTLENRGYIVERDGKYELGLRLLELGGGVTARQRVINVVEPNMKRLVAEAHETSVFAVLGSNAAVVIELERPLDLKKPVGLWIGTHLPLYCSATGKAILSALSGETVDVIVSELSFSEHTDETVTDESELYAHLDRARTEGYAFDMGERNEAVRGVATAVTPNDQKVVGALGIVGPAGRLDDDRFTHELPHLLDHYTERIEHEFQT